MGKCKTLKAFFSPQSSLTLASSFSSTSVCRGRECLGSSLAKIALGCSSSDSLSDGGSLIQASRSSLRTHPRLLLSFANESSGLHCAKAER